MVQRKLTSSAARGRGRLGVSAGRGGLGTMRRFEQCLLAASRHDADAASASGSVQAETPSVAGQRDVIRSVMPFAGVSVITNGKHLKGDCFTIQCGVMVCKDLNTEVPLPDIQQHLNHLFETKVGADVTFNVSEETIAAHRCVLATRSPIFMAQLFDPMKDGDAMCDIQIEHMEANVFRALRCFIYTYSFPELENYILENDEAEVEEGQEVDVVYAAWLQWMQDLLVAADRYDIQRLKFCCEEELSEHMDVSSGAS